ncbi:methyltransferase domain-containing protein [Streptomyces cyaneofuscatus]
MASPAGLLEILRDKGTPLGPWGDAVASVPRELFLPDAIEVGDELVSRAASPARWLEAAYSDVSVTTQVNGGRPTGPDEYRLPTSSSSQPSVMLEMLSLLDVQATDRILELGSGTGLNAAWLAHRVGSDRVVSVEIDPVLAEQGAKNTLAAGLSPFIVQGDGEQGWPGGAPFQRVIATYAVTAPRRLWDEAEAAYRTWEALGRPSRDRAGLSVTADGQQVWLDTPEHGLSALADSPGPRGIGD